ncbi:MAG: hypothetical protein ACFFBD_26115 [Candidatus Hodarchaeota archaeon]
MERIENEFSKTRIHKPLPNRDTEGRPMWWHNGSYFIATSDSEKRLAVLHQRTTAKDEAVLSERARKIQRGISVLSKWFPITFLDETGRFLLFQEESLPQEPELILKFLGILEALLRDKKLTIRWNVLFEISETFDISIEKSQYTKYLFWAKTQLNLSSFDTYAIAKRLVISTIASKNLAPDKKRALLATAAGYCNRLKEQKFIFKDPELCAEALVRLALNERSPMKLPQSLRKKTSRLVYRIKKALDI